MGSSVHLFFFFFLCVLLSKVVKGKGLDSQCDVYTGTWKVDESYPLYQLSTCPFIENEFSCERNGRPDLIYTHYRWQPSACNLLRFNGRDFLEKMRGKSIMFVGDSLSRNQWESLTCLLHSALPNTPYNLSRVGVVSTFAFPEYSVKVMLDRNMYLVDIVGEVIGKRVLKLDSIQESSKVWQEIDMLIFNTWHWWNGRGENQLWDYIELGGKLYKDMDRMMAFKEALKTWGAWVEVEVDTTKVRVLFQGISPTHFDGSQWNESGKSCLGQKTPVSGSTYPGELSPALAVLKNVLSTIKKPVTLFDITTLSLFRKDGHPSIYGRIGSTGSDCIHWCLSGVPDTWNEILYNLI